jgi:transposase
VSRTAGLAVAAEKKSLIAAERNPRNRAWFWRKMKPLGHNRLKFIDESGVTTRLTRRFGRAAPGERIGEAVPKNYGPSTSVVSVIGVEGVDTAMVIEGAVDTLVFDAFCDQCLRPCLRAGDVVVLDNLGAHRASRIEETAHECNARVIWLLPYSPDFSPIEPMWSKLKTYLRKVKARTTAELDRAVAEGLRLITPRDCHGWFTHCGYQVA